MIKNHIKENCFRIFYHEKFYTEILDCIEDGRWFRPNL